MPDFSSIDAILAFAITQEEKAVEMYSQLAAQATQAHIRQAYEEFAEEERQHKRTLQTIRESGGLRPSAEQIASLGLAESLSEVEPSGALDYQQMLIYAMQREQAAVRMYEALAQVAEDPQLRRTLEALAQEEAKHQLRFETEYDETVLTEG